MSEQILLLKLVNFSYFYTAYRMLVYNTKRSSLKKSFTGLFTVYCGHQKLVTRAMSGDV